MSGLISKITVSLFFTSLVASAAFYVSSYEKNERTVAVNDSQKENRLPASIFDSGCKVEKAKCE